MSDDSNNLVNKGPSMRGRPIHELSRDYLLAAEQAERLAIPDAAREKLATYQRFIERNAHRLEPVPGTLREVALAEPLDSPIRADVLAELEARRWKPRGMWLRRLHAPPTNPNPALLRVINVESMVFAVAAFEQDGWLVLLLGCLDRMVYAYDARTSERLRSFAGHTERITAVCALGADRVVTMAHDQTVRVWDARSSRLVLELKGHMSGISAVCALGAGQVVTGSDDDTARVWDARSGRSLLVLRGHTNGVSAVCALGVDRVVIGSRDNMARVWDAQSGRTLLKLEGHTNYVWAVCALGANRVVTGSQDNMARVWDVGSGRCRCLLVFPFDCPVICLTVVEQKPPLLVVGLADGHVQFFRIENG
jgi:WD40 repeat protein